MLGWRRRRSRRGSCAGVAIGQRNRARVLVSRHRSPAQWTGPKRRSEHLPERRTHRGNPCARHKPLTDRRLRKWTVQGSKRCRWVTNERAKRSSGSIWSGLDARKPENRAISRALTVGSPTWLMPQRGRPKPPPSSSAHQGVMSTFRASAATVNSCVVSQGSTRSVQAYS